MAKSRPQKSKYARRANHSNKPSRAFNAWANSIISQNPSAETLPHTQKPPILSLSDMLQQYNAHLGYHNQQDLRRLDIIDMEHLFTHINQIDQSGDYITRQTAQLEPHDQMQLKDYVTNHAWLSTLPCTPEGIVRLENALTYFAFDRLSLEDQQIDLHLTKWTAVDHDIPMYHYDIYVTVDFAVNGWKKPLMMFRPKSKNATQVNNCYRILHACDWDKHQAHQWTTVLTLAENLVNAEKDSYEHLKQKCATDFPELYYEVISFLQNMAIANSVMAATDKPAVQTSIDRHRNSDTAIVVGVDKTSSTQVQHFGKLIVTAKHTVSPIRSLPTLISYTQNQWQVRGHIRTYKNGHSVYVKPHINKRHEMPESDTAKQSQKIRVLH